MKKGILIGAIVVAVAVAVGVTVYWNLPDTRAGRVLNKAMAHMTAMNYVEAKEAFEEVLAIDETSIRAYRGLADDYLAQGLQTEAEQILRKGYEMTGDQVLLQNYNATVLNYAVKEINGQSTGWQTVERILALLEEQPGNEDAQKLLIACASWMLGQNKEGCLMLDGLDGSEYFSAYAAFLERLFALAATDSAAYVPIIEDFLFGDETVLYLSLSHREEWYEILTRANALGIAEASELLACLDKQAQISDFFAPMFADFEAGNFKAAKAFITSEEYVAIRDNFIEGTMDYWKENSYVPVTKEAIAFEKTQDGWQFFYVENDSLAQPSGAIRVLGEKMKDLGVQRSAIEYVPAYDPAQYYPHTEYEIVYWNTMVSGIATDNTNVISRMNYRFAKKIFSERGMEAEMIYDWGGPNETRKKE